MILNGLELIIGILFMNLTLDQFYDQFNSRIPMGRVGEAREAGDVIVFLCSGMASYVTGTAINADGGMSPVV